MSDDMKVPDANRDPISGTPGAHPLGVGAGAAGGAAAGGAIGAAVGGPVGAVVGGVAGAVAGGMAGKGAAEMVDPTAEDAYWRQNYADTTPAGTDLSYETFQPAYRMGWESPARYPGESFDTAEPKLRDEWEKGPHARGLSWDRAKQSVKNAWHRVEHAVTGHSGDDVR